jgi:hypothetical protein
MVARTALALAGLASVALGAAGCKRYPREGADRDTPAAKVSLPPEVLAELNARILARQRTVKAWQAVSIADGAAPCPTPPAAPSAVVTGFRTGTDHVKGTMEIVSAAELAGKPDPSLPPDVAADMLKISAAGRKAPAPNGWAEMDYTTDELPFRAGPIASAVQLEVRKLAMGQGTVVPADLRKRLGGRELVLVVDQQTRPFVNTEARTFTPGTMAGVALLYSYDAGAVACAGRFRAKNEASKFEADKGQAVGIPEEELQLLAYRDAIAHLVALPVK